MRSRAFRTFAVCSILCAIVVAIYYPATRGPSVFDSKRFEESTHGRVVDGINLPDLPDSGSRYFLYWSHDVSSFIFGNEVLTQKWAGIVVHCLTAIMIFFLLRLIFFTAYKRGLPSEYYAAFGAFLFAVCPAALYSTVYVVQRSIQLATLFSILSVMSYIKAVNLNKIHYRIPLYFLSAYMYFCAAHSKEHIVMLPVVIIAAMILYRDRLKNKSILIESGVLVAVCLPFLWRLYLGHSAYVMTAIEYHARQTLELFRDKSGVDIVETYWIHSAIAQCKFFFYYLRDWVVAWPQWTSIDLKPVITDGRFTFSDFAWVGAFFAYPLVCLWLLLGRGLRSIAGFCLSVPWIMFWTEPTTARIAEQFVLYRSYAWMWPLYGVIPYVAQVVGAKRKHIIPVGIAIALSFTAVTAYKARLFSTRAGVWHDAVVALPEDKTWGGWHTLNSYCSALLQDKRASEAIPYCEMARESNPKYANAWHNEAVAYLSIREWDKSKYALEQTIKHGQEKDVYYSTYGILLGSQGLHDEALEKYDEAIKHRADNAPANYNSAIIYTNRREYGKALDRAKVLLGNRAIRGRVKTLIKGIEDRQRAYSKTKEGEVR